MVRILEILDKMLDKIRADNPYGLVLKGGTSLALHHLKGHRESEDLDFDVDERKRDEVEKIIEVPLSHLTPNADPSDDWSEVDYDRDPHFPDFFYGGETIWGTTASITANFIGILKNNKVV